MYSGKSNSFLIIEGSNKANHYTSKPQLLLPLTSCDRRQYRCLNRRNICCQRDVPVHFAYPCKRLRHKAIQRFCMRSELFKRFSGSRTTIILCGWRLQALGLRDLPIILFVIFFRYGSIVKASCSTPALSQI